jgi:hypothetical protein
LTLAYEQDCTFSIIADWTVSELFVQLTRTGQSEVVTEKGIPWGPAERLQSGCVAMERTEAGGADEAYNKATGKAK